MRCYFDADNPRRDTLQTGARQLQLRNRGSCGRVVGHQLERETGLVLDLDSLESGCLDCLQYTLLFMLAPDRQPM